MKLPSDYIEPVDEALALRLREILAGRTHGTEEDAAKLYEFSVTLAEQGLIKDVTLAGRQVEFTYANGMLGLFAVRAIGKESGE